VVLRADGWVFRGKGWIKVLWGIFRLEGVSWFGRRLKFVGYTKLKLTSVCKIARSIRQWYANLSILPLAFLSAFLKPTSSDQIEFL